MLNEITGTEHDGLCENCDEPLTLANLVETSIGFYCSETCVEAGEDHSNPFDVREDFHSDG
jgi:hypothetical protein